MYDDESEGPLMGEYRSSANLVNTPPPSYEAAVGLERFPGEPVAQDKIWAIVFWIQFIVLVIVSVFTATNLNTSDQRQGKGEYESLGFLQDTQFKGLLAICVFMPLISSSLSLELMRRYAHFLVWASLMFGVFSFVSMSVLFIVLGAVPGAVIFGILALLNIWWVYSIKSRIPFAIAVLETVVGAVQKHPATVGVSFGSIFVHIAWNLLWVFGAFGVLNGFQNKKYDESSTGSVSFFLLLSYYWTSQVVSNVVLTTCAGVIAEWYFRAPYQQPKATSRSLKRAMTTSFGSICCGSFLVAFIKVLRQLVQKNNRDREERQNFLQCIAQCLLSCLQGLIETVNFWAFTYVAIYGTPYCDAARSTFELFKFRGFDAVINEDLISGVLNMMAIISSIFSAIIVYIFGEFVLSAEKGSVILCVGLSFFLTLVFSMTCLNVISAAVAALYVSYAEDPSALANTKPLVYNKLTNSFLERYRGKVSMFS